MTHRLTQWLDEQESCCEAATAGPWREDKTDGYCIVSTSKYVVSVADDTRFIAAARTSLPVALKMIRAVLDGYDGNSEWIPAALEVCLPEEKQ